MTNQIQLYTLATPNGRKASIALEEMELPYNSHRINLRNGDQFSDEFIAINPNSKIPVIIDPLGPADEPIVVVESGAILIYLAEKSGRFLSEDPRLRSETFQWLFFQVANIGPMFGQFGHFYKAATEDVVDKYALDRYQRETLRLLKILDERLEGREYLVGEEYSIADIATFPWVGALDWGYDAKELLGIDSFKNITKWLEACESRPAAQKGAKICPVD